MDEQDYISVSEAAAQLGYNKSRLYQMVRAGQIPSSVIGGFTLLKRSDVEKIPPKGSKRVRYPKQQGRRPKVDAGTLTSARPA